MGQFIYTGDPERDRAEANAEKKKFLKSDIFNRYLVNMQYSEKDIYDLDVEEWDFFLKDFMCWLWET